jgi:hypothetical protein
MKSQVVRFCVVFAICISVASAQQLFDIKPVADGVYTLARLEERYVLRQVKVVHPLPSLQRVGIRLPN